jgi:hypothetical protein
MILSPEEKEFRQKCRLRALEVARDLRPPPQYGNNLQQALANQPYYDVIKEAEKIYQWLIKEDVTA